MSVCFLVLTKIKSFFRKNVLGRYRNQDLTLTLPDGKTLKDIKWISVWCRAFSVSVNFVYLIICKIFYTKLIVNFQRDYLEASKPK